MRSVVKRAFVGVFLTQALAGGAAQAAVEIFGAASPRLAIVHGVSADGTTAVGSQRRPPFDFFYPIKVGADRNVTGLEDARGHALAVSADGSAVVGQAETSEGDRSILWRSGAPAQVIGGFRTSIRGLSASGEVLVGSAQQVGGQFRALRWTQSGQVELLPQLFVGQNSFAGDVSADGTVIVGTSGNTPWVRATIWHRGIAQDLGVLPDMTFSQARSVSQNGLVVVGISGTGDGLTNSLAFRWTESTGMLALGSSAQGAFVSAETNGDGSLVAGKVLSPAGVASAYAWTQTSGVVSLSSYLTTAGLSVDNWQFTDVTGISSDGRVIVGNGLYEGQVRSFIATIPSPSSLTLFAGMGWCVQRRRRSIQR